MIILFEKTKSSIHEFKRLYKGLLRVVLRDGLLVAVVVCTAYITHGVSLIELENTNEKSISICQKGFDMGSKVDLATNTRKDENISPELNLKPSNAYIKPSSNVVKSVVASKKGSKYHFPWCVGASQIKEENKVWYENEEEAIRAGLEKAKNCN